MNLFDTRIPNVIECHYFSSRHTSFNQSVRVVANYELDYNLQSGRTMTVNDKIYEIEKDSLVFRRPGEIVKSKGIYNMYVLTFTFDQCVKNYNRNSPHQHPHIASDIELLNHLPTYIKPHYSSEITEIYKQLLSSYSTGGGDEVCSHLVMKLLYLFAAESTTIKISSLLSNNSKANEIMTYISEHYGEQITLDVIADHVHLDKSYMIRCLKKAINKTPIEYLTEKRISVAKSLLIDTDLSISEIASLCGFSDTSYFTFKFRSVVGTTPTKYRAIEL